MAIKAENLVVRVSADVLMARHVARSLARQVAFHDIEVNEIEIVVMELCSNLLKYAGGGRIAIEIVAEGLHRGIRIEASDKGPGIPDVALALARGYSTSGSLGTGLPVVLDLVDRFDIETHAEIGTTILVEKWVHDRPWWPVGDDPSEKSSYRRTRSEVP